VEWKNNILIKRGLIMDNWRDRMSIFLKDFFGKEFPYAKDLHFPLKESFIFFEEYFTEDERDVWKFSFRYEDNVFEVFDLVVPKEYRSRGFLKKLLEYVESEFPNSDIEFQYVINRRLYNYLKRYGFRDTKENWAKQDIQYARTIPHFDGAFPNVKYYKKRMKLK
jgi:GNAT superfamily N-acetyltransferase